MNARAHRKAVPNSPFSKALNYSLIRWTYFTRYADDISPIDNNAVENAIHSIAIDKKNLLFFAGSERAGNREAAIQSLLASAKANGLNHNAWMIETLTRLP